VSPTGDDAPSPPAAGPRRLRDRIGAFVGRRSDFAINTAKLSSGTILRFLIAVGTIPIVTRLYAPQDFGDLQLLLSIIATFAGISTLKYDTAMVLPEERVESESVAVLCLVVVGLLALLLGTLLFAFGDWFFGLFDAQRLQPFAGLVVLGFVAAGLLRTSHYALIARRRFGGLAKNNVLQVSTTQGTYVALGLWQPSFLGLFAGQMAGHAAALLHALWQAPFRIAGVRAERLWALARRYRKFPMVNTPGVFVNSLAYEMPVFLLARYFDADVVGFYMLTERLLNQPTTLIGEAVAKVYLQEAASARHRGTAELRSLFRRTARRLFLVGAPFALCVVVAAPPVVEIALGEGYRQVGVMMQILVLGRFLGFVVTPLVTTFSVVNRQEISMVLMGLSAASRFGAMLAFSDTWPGMLLALAVATGVFALVFLIVIDRVLGSLERPRTPDVG